MTPLIKFPLFLSIEEASALMKEAEKERCSVTVLLRRRAGLPDTSGYEEPS